MMRTRRLFTAVSAAFAVLLATAVPALAGADGEGLYGPADDKVITYTAFILLVTIPLLIVILNFLQSQRQKRKKERGGTGA